ncbi:hypothetical protein CCL10_14520 [Pseudomonas syringae]|nr:hypothetical protein CCL10_14520 [Pseudomonas syringae]
MPLIFRRPNGSLVFNSDYVAYGLVKSAYLSADETWPRKYLRGSNVDPNDPNSYQDSFRAGDQMFSVTVNDAQSPMCFLTGKGTLQGSYRNGDTMKFFFSGADSNTKVYVFDLMRDTAGSPPFFKTRNASGKITFNSLQTPLNIAYSIQAPQPSATDRYGKYPSPYNGGSWQSIRAQTANFDPVAHFVVDVSLPAGEYAAYLNFARNCLGVWGSPLTNVNGQYVGMSEGAYGRSGGISFMFGPAGATTDITVGSTSAYTLPGSVDQLPLDRMPTALVVNTAVLPFPFN